MSNTLMHSEYKLPLLYRFTTADDFVSKEEAMQSLDSSLQDVISDFTKYLSPVDSQDFLRQSVHTAWCKKLTERLLEMEPRLLNVKVSVLTSSKKQVHALEILAQLSFDESIYISQFNI